VSRPFILIGDTTDHGGVVLEGTQVSDIGGKPIARVGDKVSCPKHGHGQNGIVVIVSGDPTLIIDGQPLARHGDKTSCGAMLLSTQVTTTVDGGDGTGGGRKPSSGALASSAASSSLGHLMQAPPAESFDLHFLVKDEDSGDPMANVPYKLTLETGRSITGTTDKDGLTQVIGANEPITAKLEVPFYGHGTSNADSHGEHGACNS
jgi:uncharacterized Zn-binding protein involved in type VI secretion